MKGKDVFLGVEKYLQYFIIYLNALNKLKRHEQSCNNWHEKTKQKTFKNAENWKHVKIKIAFFAEKFVKAPSPAYT